MSDLFNYDAPGLSRFGANSWARKYPDPFLTFSTFLMPRTVAELLRWCESLWVHNGTYARAMQRVIAYFITKVEISNVSGEEKKRYEELLNDKLVVSIILSLAGADFMAYGNSFTSIYVPFKRLLSCNHCQSEVPINKLDYTFSKGKFQWKCSKCKKACIADKPIDRRTSDETKVRFKRWSPHEIRIKSHPISNDKIYLWDPPKDIVKLIKNGDRFTIQYFPWEMIEAILQDKMFEFGPDVVFHMCNETLSGFRTNGWGISSTLNNFSQAYYVQMAKMFNEVLMQEYIVPFRVISPPTTGKGTTSDPLLATNINGFNSKVLGMLEQHRRNPGGYYALPFPVEYQSLGGEGMQMTTYEHIAQANDDMLNAAGVPAELYKGNLEFQVLPTALRLFQQTWPHIKTNFDKFLSWTVETLATVFNWEKATAVMQPVTLADDIEKRQFFMQLLAGNKISQGTALTPLGIDFESELGKIYDERRRSNEEEERFNRELQQKQQLQQSFMGGGGGGAPGAGAPGSSGGGSGGVPGGGADQSAVTPDDMLAKAQSEAERLLSLPYEIRRGEMSRIKKTNPTLHSIIKGYMQEIRQQMNSAGGYQMMQQQLGGGQGGPQV